MDNQRQSYQHQPTIQTDSEGGSKRWIRSHCEPDVALSKSAIEKEQRFHDINPKVVSEVVRLTFAVIRAAWFKVHGRPGPRWLPNRRSDGHYDRIDVRLCQTDREDDSTASGPKA
jgi:hypothetical protein